MTIRKSWGSALSAMRRSARDASEKVKLTGSRGSSFLIEWASRLQGPQSTSSTESESIEWGRAAQAMLRVKRALDACRLKPVPFEGYVDNDALRMAVSRGSSAKLGHLRVHGS